MRGSTVSTVRPDPEDIVPIEQLLYKDGQAVDVEESGDHPDRPRTF